MKIHLPDTPLSNPFRPNEPVTMRDAEGKTRPATVKAILVESLLVQQQGEAMSGEKKLKHYQLAQRVHEAKGILQLSTEDASLLKDLVAKLWPPLFVGLLFPILDGETPVEERKLKPVPEPAAAAKEA